MTEPFPLETYREGIAEVATSVWDTMMHIPLKPVGPCPPPSSPFTSAVYYAGAWKGALLIECSGEQAADWAARLMSLDPPVTPDDMRDGLGELTNVVAGNLKPLLPPGVGLSLPSVVQGSDYSLRFCREVLSQSLCFEDPLGPFRITLLEVLIP